MFPSKWQLLIPVGVLIIISAGSARNRDMQVIKYYVGHLLFTLDPYIR